MTAIAECADAADGVGLQSIADGGIKNPGDVAKALAAGADMVMLGGMLAGTDEAPGEMMKWGNQKVKSFRGMASYEAGSNYAEGISGSVPYKGPVKNILNGIFDGLKSACSYSGVDNLKDYGANAVFVESAHASTVVRESAPHDVIGA